MSGTSLTCLLTLMFQTNKLLGIRELNVYEADMTNMTSVFQHYTSEGSLILHHMPPPVVILPPNNSFRKSDLAKYKYDSLESILLASTASLNDCMMKNLYRYRYQ